MQDIQTFGRMLRISTTPLRHNWQFSGTWIRSYASNVIKNHPRIAGVKKLDKWNSRMSPISPCTRKVTPVLLHHYSVDVTFHQLLVIVIYQHYYIGGYLYSRYHLRSVICPVWYLLYSLSLYGFPGDVTVIQNTYSAVTTRQPVVNVSNSWAILQSS